MTDATDDIWEKVGQAMAFDDAAVEAFCRELLKEKGVRSTLDYELVRQTMDTCIRWYFRPKTDRQEGATDSRDERIAELETAFTRLQAIVGKQVEDEGLWFVTRTASEVYLQQELRKLHEAVEQVLVEEDPCRECGKRPVDPEVVRLFNAALCKKCASFDPAGGGDS